MIASHTDGALFEQAHVSWGLPARHLGLRYHEDVKTFILYLRWSLWSQSLFSEQVPVLLQT